MATRNGRTFSSQYHRQIALEEVEASPDHGEDDVEFAALLDDYCRRVNGEPSPRRPAPPAQHTANA